MVVMAVVVAAAQGAVRAAPAVVAPAASDHTAHHTASRSLDAQPAGSLGTVRRTTATRNAHEQATCRVSSRQAEHHD